MVDGRVSDAAGVTSLPSPAFTTARRSDLGDRRRRRSGADTGRADAHRAVQADGRRHSRCPSRHHPAPLTSLADELAGLGRQQLTHSRDDGLQGPSGGPDHHGERRDLAGRRTRRSCRCPSTLTPSRSAEPRSPSRSLCSRRSENAVGEHLLGGQQVGPGLGPALLQGEHGRRRPERDVVGQQVVEQGGVAGLRSSASG